MQGPSSTNPIVCIQCFKLTYLLLWIHMHVNLMEVRGQLVGTGSLHHVDMSDWTQDMGDGSRCPYLLSYHTTLHAMPWFLCTFTFMSVPQSWLQTVLTESYCLEFWVLWLRYVIRISLKKPTSCKEWEWTCSQTHSHCKEHLFDCYSLLFCSAVPFLFKHSQVFVVSIFFFF